MKTLPTLMLVLFLAACGAPKPVEEDATNEVTEQTSEPPEQEAPATEEEEGAKLPAPPDVAAPPAGAESSESGLAWIVLTPGDGAGHPTLESVVTVHYSGWQTNGEMFDSSVVRGEPAEFPLNKLIVGWQEGIPLMSKGEKRRFWIPGALAYDGSTREGVPRGTLVFDIELIDFK